MTTIRIGNDIFVVWKVFSRNGMRFSLQNQNIRIWLASGPFKMEITDFTTSIRGEVAFKIDADSITRYGIYKLELSIYDNDAETEDATFDVNHVFQIVSTNYEDTNNPVLDGSVELEPCSILNNVVTSTLEGASAYEIAVNHGYRGTEEEWLHDPVNGIEGNGVKSFALVGTFDPSPSGSNTYRITPYVGDPFDFVVKNGVGLTSVTAVQSTADSGQSTYTLNFSDGTEQAIIVKNGKGIASIEKTTEGVGSDADNVFTITYSDGTTKQFTIKNGSQGNSGVVLDGVTEEAFVEDMIVNNLVDGGATKALSAEQGKELNEKIDGRYVSANQSPLIDVDYFSLYNYSVNADGTYGTSNAFKHAAIPVKPGERFTIKFAAAGRYAFATAPSGNSGSSISLVPGTSVYDMVGPLQENIVIPEGCTHLLAYQIGGSDDETTYSFKKYPADEITRMQAQGVVDANETIKTQQGAIFDYVPGGANKTVSDYLIPGRSYFIVINSAAEIKSETIGFCVSSLSNVTTYILKDGLLNKGLNIFKVTYDGSPYLYIGNYSSISHIYIYDAADTLLGDALPVLDSVLERAGGLKTSKPVPVSQGDYIAHGRRYRVDIKCSGRIGLFIYDENSALAKFNIFVFKEGEDSFTLLSANNTAVKNGWVYFDLPYTITAVEFGTASGTIASTDTCVYIKAIAFGSLWGQIDSLGEIVTEHTAALAIPDYVDLDADITQAGKAVGSSGIVNDSNFNLYTFAIEEGKNYYIHAFLNSGWSNRNIVCFSSDVDALDVTGLAYPGSATSPVYVPNAASGAYYQKLNIPAGSNYFHIGIRNTEFAVSYLHVAYSVNESMFNASSFESRLEAVEQSISVGNEIASLYGGSEHRAKVRAIFHRVVNGRGNEDSNIDSSQPQPLVLLHFSDVHGSDVNYERVMDYHKLYKDLIDDVINTGDLVSDYYEDGIVSLSDISGFENVLNVIGNHDTRKRNSEYSDSRQWSEYAGKDAYDRYIAPYIENWGDENNPIVQPQNAASAGKCYFYKDYAAKKIRLITIDNMVMLTSSANFDAGQIDWFEAVLADALQNEMTVVVAMHFPNDNGVIDCAFSGYGQTPGGGAWATSEINKYFAAVAEFKRDGGEFACWICGHSHRSLLGYPNGHQDQLIVCVGSAIEDARSAWPRVTGTKTQDFFHLMGIDTARKSVSVLQIGVEYDSMMRHRECFSYRYDTGTIVKMSE